MSWFGRLFRAPSSASADAATPVAAEIEYNGFTVRAVPYKGEGGQFQTAGSVLKEIGGELREHAFVRADRFGSLDDATAVSLQKGRQLVDEQGERLFGPKP